MDATRAASRRARFGVFELDSHTRELRKNGMKIKLTGQPTEVLAPSTSRR
jgi:DNA-binding response OmpR family regulator